MYSESQIKGTEGWRISLRALKTLLHSSRWPRTLGPKRLVAHAPVRNTAEEVNELFEDVKASRKKPTSKHRTKFTDGPNDRPMGYLHVG